jgi:glycosyltransferase involved in cell wall biosynthesis
MRILINGTATLPGTAGETYFVDIFEALSRLSDDAYSVVFTSRQDAIAAGLPPSVDIVRVELPPGRMARGLAVQRLLPALAKTTGSSILYNRGNFFVRRAGLPQVCFIENSNVFSNRSIPWTVRDRIRNAILRRLTRMAFRQAAHLIYSSATAAEIFRKFGGPSVPSTVIHYGWRELADRPQAGGPDPARGRYLLCVSSAYPHKNLPRLVRGFRRFVERDGYAGALAIVGYAELPQYRADLTAVVAAERLQDRVWLMPAMSPSVLAGWYRTADALVMPSLEEAFGLPVLEAMGYGRPVAAADTALSNRRDIFFNPFHEICADVAEYFDPFSESSIADSLARVTVPARAAELSRRGPARAALFTWDNAALKLTRVFHEVARAGS